MRSVEKIIINKRAESKRIERYTYTTGAIEFSGPLSLNEAEANPEYGYSKLDPLVPCFLNEDGTAAPDGVGLYLYWPAEIAQRKYSENAKDGNPYYKQQYELFVKYYK